MWRRRRRSIRCGGGSIGSSSISKLDGAMVARVVVDLLGLSGKPWVLAMDRTNWDFGKTTINILMISVIWNGMGIPLIWTLLPSAGNSNTRARSSSGSPEENLSRSQNRFADGRSRVHRRSLDGLSERNKIGFILRLRENQYVVHDGYEHGRSPTSLGGWTWAKNNNQRLVSARAKRQKCSPAIRLVIMRLPTGEFLALACSATPRRALENYRQSWTIETLFANLKTKGFNLEDTHITDPDKLSTLWPCWRCP